MAGIDRRGFVAGLGALLGTTALVKPQLPAMTTTYVQTAPTDYAELLDELMRSMGPWQMPEIDFGAVCGHLIEINGFEIIDHGTRLPDGGIDILLIRSETPNPVDN